MDVEVVLGVEQYELVTAKDAVLGVGRPDRADVNAADLVFAAEKVARVIRWRLRRAKCTDPAGTDSQTQRGPRRVRNVLNGFDLRPDVVRGAAKDPASD